jgi:hypothetical protein
MPQFTQWNVPSPFSNVLFNPAAVDKSIAELGHLGVERERLDLDRAQMAKDQAFTDRLIEAAKNAAGTETGTAPAGGGGGGALGGPPDINTPAGQVAQRTAAFWSSQGYTPHQVAGILAGGPAAESGFNPAAVGDGGTSLGLYQHHADRMEAMKKRYGPNPTEAQQHEFAAWEISPQGTHAHVGAALKQAKTPEEAAAIWTKEFERPANADARAAQRAAVASRYLNYGNAGPRASLAATAPPEYNPAAGPRVGSVPPAAAPAIVPPSPTTAQIPPPVRAAAQALLAMPEAEAAVAYGPIVKELQAQGLAQNAPPEYPGHEAVAALVGGEAATPDVAPSRQAMRLGGTAAAGPAAGQTTLPPTEQPNQLYQTGIPGITLRLPGSGPLAPPPVVTAAAPPSPGTASGGAATRAPVLQQPAPAPSRVIPMDPQIQSGLFAGLTRKQAMSVAEMSAGGAKPAAVMLHIDQLRQHNDVLRQQNATNAAAEAEANYRRQEDYRKAQDEAAKDAQTRADKAVAAENEKERIRLLQAADKRADADAKRAGLPTGYRIAEDGSAYRIPGLPEPDEAGKQAERQFNQENTLRDEFQKLTGDFRIVQTSFENIRSAAKANDGAGDMSMLYNYVRLLDPTSVVRESEFAAAAASGSFGQRVQGAVERVLSGARMPETLRESFIREGRNLYNNQLRSHNTVADQYEELARSHKLDPRRVVTRFARPQEDAPSDPLAAARDAISKGASRDAVIKRLRDNGVDPGGL